MKGKIRKGKGLPTSKWEHRKTGKQTLFEEGTKHETYSGQKTWNTIATRAESGAQLPKRKE